MIYRFLEFLYLTQLKSSLPLFLSIFESLMLERLTLELSNGGWPWTPDPPCQVCAISHLVCLHACLLSLLPPLLWSMLGKHSGSNYQVLTPALKRSVERQLPTPPFPQPGNHLLDVSLNLAISIPHLSGIIQYPSFCDWTMCVRIMSLRSLDDVTYGKISPFEGWGYECMCSFPLASHLQKDI